MPSRLELLRAWTTSISHVVLDFGEEQLWWLRPESDEFWSYLVTINRSTFINFHIQQNSHDLDAFVKKYDKVLSQRGTFPSLDDYYHFKDKTLS